MGSLYSHLAALQIGLQQEFNSLIDFELIEEFCPECFLSLSSGKKLFNGFVPFFIAKIAIANLILIFFLQL